jgi:hypothetical protein
MTGKFEDAFNCLVDIGWGKVHNVMGLMAFSHQPDNHCPQSLMKHKYKCRTLLLKLKFQLVRDS